VLVFVVQPVSEKLPVICWVFRRTQKRPISTLLTLLWEGRQAMEITQILPLSQMLIKELSEGMNRGGLSLEQTEAQILEFVYELACELEQQVVKGLKEPTEENSVVIAGRLAVYAGRRRLSYRNRFGGRTVMPRRCYKYCDGHGGWTPLDERLGLDR